MVSVAAGLLVGPQAARSAAMTGTWDNTTFGSSGPLTFSYDISGTDVSGIFELGGFVFGGPPPEPTSLSGTVGGDGTISFGLTADPIFGDLTGTIAADGTLSVSMTAVPGFIRDVTVSGTVTETQLAGTYRVEFETSTPEGSRAEGDDFALGTMQAVAIVPEPATNTLLGLGVLWLLGAARRRR